MTSILKSFCLLFFCCCFGMARAQNLKFKHISIEDGLSNSTIECIFQDHRGFIWFGTRDGLNKYDGIQITVYKSSKATTSLSDNYIRCIYEGKDKTLWIGTSNGLNRFNPEQNNFTRYKSVENNINSLSNNTITSIEENNRGLWVGTTGGGLNLLDLKKRKFEHYRQQSLQHRIGNDNVNALHTDKNKNLWVATAAGLDLYDQQTHTFNRVHGLENYVIRIISEAGDGSLWLGTEDKGLIHFDPATKSFKTYRHQDKNTNSIGSDLVRAIVFDKKNNIWLGGINGGLDLFNTEMGTFKHYQNEPGNPSSLSQRTVSALYEDKQGNLWIGTHRGGINLYSPGSEKFKLFKQEPLKNSLSYNDVKAFYEDEDGNIWIGTDGGGLNFFNRKTNWFTSYKNNPFNAQTIGSDAVLSIMEDQSHNIWVGTWGGGLNLLNKKTGTFTKFVYSSSEPSSISSNYVQQSFEDSENQLWIGTYYGGLNLFDRSTQKFKRVVYGGDGTRLIGNNIIAINEDKNKNLWIGTDDGGLNCYNLKTKSFSHFFLNEEKKPDLRVIFIDSKNRLWIGQAGLYLFNQSKKTFALYTRKAGLATDFIKGITEDEKGNFWISTSKGLTKFNPETLSFMRYNTADGLQGLEFEANAYLKTKKGEMFFGGINGFNSFFPDDIRTNKYVPPVYLTEFYIFNNKMMPGAKNSPLQKDISLTKEIAISHRQSTFYFNFAALNYTSSENNRYAFRLEGFDKTWIEASNSRRPFYTNLDPGTYTFRVKASNNDNVWNNVGTAVKIVISPPFWATLWFRLLITLLLCSIAYAILSFKRKLELRTLEEQKREEMHEIQFQFFTNISHEFRTPLSLILGPIDRLLKEDSKGAFQNYYRTIHRNANRLLGLINELMDFRKVEAGALKLKVIQGNLSLFIDEVAEEFTDMALDKNIDFKVKKMGTFNDVWFDRHVLEKIILNLINNSLKYTKNGGAVTLEILSSLDNVEPCFENQLFITSNYSAQQYVYIRVVDNGIGISKDSIHHLFERYYRITESHLGSAIGLAFVKSLTLLHKGLIKVSSEKYEGTEIIIGLPCNKNDYAADELWGQYTEQGGTRLESISYKSDQHFLPSNTKQLTANAITKHILIVDDNEELRAFLKETLIGDYHISEAGDGKSGFEKAKEEFPDLVISDVMMPGMDGTEFCKLLKGDLETSHIPFLMLTAKNSVSAEIEGVESGADHYFTKPININLLQTTIKNIFEQRQKLKDHYAKDHHTDLIDLVHSTKDRDFMARLLSIINEQLINPELDIDYLCSEIGMSRTKLYQKIKTISGQSIGEFIRSIRLRKAVEIMTREDVLLTEVMYRVGIQTQSYFTKAFKKEFGKTPTQFLQDFKA